MLAPNPDFIAERIEPVIDDWEVHDFTNLRDPSNPGRGTEVIEGLLRQGEVGVLVNSSKEGKTWMAIQLAWCVATGKPFLGMKVKQGRVLVIDNELKPREIVYRNEVVAEALGHKVLDDQVSVVSRRGKSSDIGLIASKLRTMDLSEYSLIIIDALYKCIPRGTAENDNATMGDMMNTMQGIADESGVPLLVVHHTTKGDQSHKNMIDMAAGAGSIGRSTDAMIAIREHEEDGHSVCEFKPRSNLPKKSLTIKFDWPLWKTTALEPAIRKSGKGSSNQRGLDHEADEMVYNHISDASKSLSKSEIRSKTGMGDGRIAKSLNRLEKAQRILREEAIKDQRTGKSADRWKVGCTDGCSDGCTDNL